MSIKPPDNWAIEHRDFIISNPPLTLFLAGSIEMGKAENWQSEVEKKLEDHYLIFNPRRDDWDSSWEQSIDNPQFKEQVEWELNHLELADVVLFYFSPDTKSPITLLELGICAASKPERTKVVCPEGFWRKGNVDIICQRYNLMVYNSINEACEGLR